MSYLTREQLDNYLKKISETGAKPVNSASSIAINALQNTTPKRSTSINVPPPPKSHLAESTSKSERKQVHGPRTPPALKRNRLSDSPKIQESNSSNTVVKRHSLSGLPRTSSISTKGNESKKNVSPSINAEENKSKANVSPATTEELPKTSTVKIPTTTDSNEKIQYEDIDEIVNDLSYPMETKLSLKPDNKDDNETIKNTKRVEKVANDTSKGSYVLSAAFKSHNPVPSSSDQERETTTTKQKPGSATQELQRKSQTNTNWNSRYNEANQKYPPVDQLDKENPNTPPNDTKADPNINKEVRSNRDTHLPDAGIKKPNNETSLKPTNIPKPSSSTSSIICTACEKPINGNVLSALGKKWHPEHFTCTHCNIVLEHVSFYEKDGQPYCHLDYHELFSPRCGSCDTPIEGKCINALGKYWHPGHFFCRECGNPFESGGFMVNDGFPYCEKDWLRLFAPKCNGCQQPIKGEYTNAMGVLWHSDCFCCEICREPFNGSFFVREGKPYCKLHLN